MVPVESVVQLSESARPPVQVVLLLTDADSATAMPEIFMGFLLVSRTRYLMFVAQPRPRHTVVSFELLATCKYPGFWTVAGALGRERRWGRDYCKSCRCRQARPHRKR